MPHRHHHHHRHVETLSIPDAAGPMWLFKALHVPSAKAYGPLHNFLNAIIFISAIVGALETVDSIKQHWGSWLVAAEWTFVTIFALEYVGNILTAKRKLAYIFSFWGVIDFLAIAPSFLMLADITYLKSASVLRMLRVLRVLRVLKLAREAVNQAQSASNPGVKRSPLGMNLTIYFLALFSVIIISSSLVYQAEYKNGTTQSIVKKDAKTLRVNSNDMHGDLSGSKVSLDGYGEFSGPFDVKKWEIDENYFEIALPDNASLEGVDLSKEGQWAKDTLFTSVPQAMWWAIVTLTTVGYGDMYPVTLLGRLVAAVTMMCGLALFGMLMNIIGNAMMKALFGTEELDKSDGEESESEETDLPTEWNPGWIHCPTCGHAHSAPPSPPQPGLNESHSTLGNTLTNRN
ncbi:MAG: potassium channel family protein [Verrucomicrobiota bacterium]